MTVKFTEPGRIRNQGCLGQSGIYFYLPCHRGFFLSGSGAFLESLLTLLISVCHQWSSRVLVPVVAAIWERAVRGSEGIWGAKGGGEGWRAPPI